VSEERHPDDRPDSRDWPESDIDHKVERGIDRPVGYPLPDSSYRWEDNAELHGDETGGQEP
jgi:hypothetical protein